MWKKLSSTRLQCEGLVNETVDLATKNKNVQAKIKNTFLKAFLVKWSWIFAVFSLLSVPNLERNPKLAESARPAGLSSIKHSMGMLWSPSGAWAYLPPCFRGGCNLHHGQLGSASPPPHSAHPSSAEAMPFPHWRKCLTAFVLPIGNVSLQMWLGELVGVPLHLFRLGAP